MAYRVFLPDADLTAPSLRISGPDFHHIAHVLRMEAGKELVLLDNRGNACRSIVVVVGKRELETSLIGPEPVAPEPSVHVTIAQAIGKGDKFEQVIQHGTEIGASAFIPLETERTIVRIRAKEVENKQARWQAVAKGAAEQTGRSKIPRIEAVSSLADVLKRRDEFEVRWMLDQSGEQPEVSGELSRYLILIGPEGGFAPNEIAAGKLAAAQIVSLGPYILRTETASLVALSRLLV
jgi:16S rRNA (uracil1498-N3)-methyltransferase